MNTHALKFLSASLLAAAIALPATPAYAQHEGHTMPMPAPKPAPKPVVKKAAPATTAKKPVPKPAATKPATKAQPATRPTARPAVKATAKPAMSGSMQGMDHSNMPGMKKSPAAPAAARKPDQAVDHSKMPGMRRAPATPAPIVPTPMQGMDHSNMPGMTQGAAPTAAEGAPVEGMDHSQMEGMDHSNMEGMDHSNMSSTDHAAMGHAADQDLPADAAPRTPIPALNDADRAAAFPSDAHGHEVHDSRAFSYWLVDRLEWQDTDEGSLGWEGLAWIGGDLNRIWLHTEGEASDAEVESANAEVLYGRAISPWWDAIVGVRHDFGEGPSRTYAALGFQGLAPYKFEVEALAFVDAGGRGGVTLEAEYDTLITNRLILQWQGETNIYAKDDVAIGVGSGLSTIEAGARLRYEFNRRFAPYVGVEFERAFGATADLRRDAGESTRDTRLVAGIRFWF